MIAMQAISHMRQRKVGIRFVMGESLRPGLLSFSSNRSFSRFR